MKVHPQPVFAAETCSITGPRQVSSPTGSVNVHRGPGIAYAARGFLNNGDEINVTGQSGAWYRIKHAGEEGWVFAPLTLNPVRCLTGETR